MSCFHWLCWKFRFCGTLYILKKQKHHDVPVMVVATKEDKLKRNDLKKNEKIIKDTLGFHPEDKFVRFSSLRKKGIEEAWNFIYELCDINFN